MVDEVLLADPKASKTSFLVRDENIFVVNGLFTEPGLIENMAQTAAAGTGYRYQQLGETVPVGFIASIKNLKIYSLPKTGDLLLTENIVVHTVMNVHMVEAMIYVGEEKIASCEMKIFEQTIP
jgi:predicted hotdog family 3-hydroxylacyl-ACP dehydratase